MATEENPIQNTPQPETQNGTVHYKAELSFKGLLDEIREKPYSPELRARRLVYAKLMDHLDDIEVQTRDWCKFIRRVVALTVFSGLAAFLVCSLTVEPTNHKRLLRLRLWQWASMALMLFGVVTVVPFSTCVAVCILLQVRDRTRRYWVYFLRKMKRSVDVMIWSCLVLFGWYVWFRPRLKHVYGNVSVIASQQTTRALIALCVGSVLWTLKNALYYKLKADLHYEQLFERIRSTVGYLNGYRILQNKGDRPSFLAYDANMIEGFWEVYEEDDGEKCKHVVKPWRKMKYVMKRKWNNWTYDPSSKMETSEKGRCCNIWMDMLEMRREDVPIWILERLTKEYMKEVRSLRPSNADQLINDDQLLLEEAKNMFIKISKSHQQQQINQADTTASRASPFTKKVEKLTQCSEIKKGDLDQGYNLSNQELDRLFKLKKHQETAVSKQGEVENETNNSTQPQQGENVTTQQEATQNELSYRRTIGIDRFLNWAVRVHKNCWGLECTLDSSKIAFVKLNRMLSTFLIVLVVIIWLLLSKIVNTAQIALLFAPFLAASFMFENSSKNLFQGLIFTFAMHPFDVGDRVIIEDIQMRVKKVNILTSVFYKYDTGAEVIFPNSKLATTKIVNLDITPDQSDELDFLIDVEKIPLENIRELELKIQKYFDDDLYYASGTKVVKKKTNNNPEKPDELQMTVHFKYLVSYLPAEKKAERRSLLLEQIMIFEKQMQLLENKKEFPLNYVPYILEWTMNKRVQLHHIEKLKREILRSLDENGHQYDKKIVLANLEEHKINMALYLSASEDLMPEELKPDGEMPLNQCFKIIDDDPLFKGCGFTSLKVSRGMKTLYPAWSESRTKAIITSPRFLGDQEGCRSTAAVNETMTPADSR